jgi:hypothetical protein
MQDGPLAVMLPPHTSEGLQEGRETIRAARLSAADGGNPGAQPSPGLAPAGLRDPAADRLVEAIRAAKPGMAISSAVAAAIFREAVSASLAVSGLAAAREPRTDGFPATSGMLNPLARRRLYLALADMSGDGISLMDALEFLVEATMDDDGKDPLHEVVRRAFATCRQGIAAGRGMAGRVPDPEAEVIACAEEGWGNVGLALRQAARMTDMPTVEGRQARAALVAFCSFLVSQGQPWREAVRRATVLSWPGLPDTGHDVAAMAARVLARMDEGLGWTAAMRPEMPAEEWLAVAAVATSAYPMEQLATGAASLVATAWPRTR